MCDLEQYPQIGSHNIIIVCIILHILSPVLYAINLDLAMLSELTHLDSEVGAHHYPSGWMEYGVLLLIVNCLSVFTMALAMKTVHTLKMLE